MFPHIKTPVYFLVKRNHQILWWSGGSKQLPELCHLFDIRDPPDQINQEFYLPSQQKTAHLCAISYNDAGIRVSTPHQWNTH